MIERTHRLETLFERNPIFFVTLCCEKRAEILSASFVHEALQQFAEAGPKRGAWIGKYVLMPDHLHVFVRLDGGKLLLSEWVKSLKNSLSKVLRSNNIAPPHWQKGFFDHVLRNSESIRKNGIMCERIP